MCKGHSPNFSVLRNTKRKDHEMSNYSCTDRKCRDIAFQKKNGILTENSLSKQRNSKTQGK